MRQNWLPNRIFKFFDDTLLLRLEHLIDQPWEGDWAFAGQSG
jgi:hypothetical protein